jgi:hypothetical protein
MAPSQEKWNQVQAAIGKHGTSLKMNEEDPMGDGDQSSFSIANETNAQFHRELWACGGDLIFQGQEGHYYSPFAQLCISGSYPELVSYLSSEQGDTEQLNVLLETRHCILRQTALMLAIVGGVNSYAADLYNPRADHVAVVKLLLSYGARTDARDLCGKTAIHYCTSRLCLQGDQRLLDMGDLIIEASKTQKVNPALVDFPDRFGNVALHDTVIARRLDLVRYLVVKHGANPTIADNYNVTPISVALPGPMRDLLIECKNKEEYKEHKSRCAKCHKVGVDTLRCGKCRVANYCSRDCQVAHWKMHKAQCNAHDATHVIITPGPLNKTPTSQESWQGKPPVGVAVDAYFDVKIQLCLHQDEAGLPLGPDPEGAYMLYNQARDISMFVADKHCPQRRVLFDLIQGVPECGGLKAYFKAKVTADGKLAVATSPVFVKKW